MHNPGNNNCPRNADPRNESCACDPPAFMVARARLYELLTSDIYTDAYEYADRVAEVRELLPVVFGSTPRAE